MKHIRKGVEAGDNGCSWEKPVPSLQLTLSWNTKPSFSGFWGCYCLKAPRADIWFVHFLGASALERKTSKADKRHSLSFQLCSTGASRAQSENLVLQVKQIQRGQACSRGSRWLILLTSISRVPSGRWCRGSYVTAGGSWGLWTKSEEESSYVYALNREGVH